MRSLAAAFRLAMSGMWSANPTHPGCSARFTCGISNGCRHRTLHGDIQTHQLSTRVEIELPLFLNQPYRFAIARMSAPSSRVSHPADRPHRVCAQTNGLGDDTRIEDAPEAGEFR